MGREGHFSRSFISCVFSCFLQISLLRFAWSQNLQIQAQPQTVDIGEDDLTIVCSLRNPSQVMKLFFIILQRNTSNSFEVSVSITFSQDNLQGRIIYPDLTLQSRTTATGSLSPVSTAELRLTFTKYNVRCPDDFKEYRCRMRGVDSNSNSISEQDAESDPVKLDYRVQPYVIQIPRVRILGELFDTNERQFEVGTAVQLTCTGQIGSDPSATIRWCAKTAGAPSFTGLPQTPTHSQSSQSGCQYTRTSSINYNLTTSDTYIQFLCESGYSGLCETGTARQYLNITLGSSELQQRVSNACSRDLSFLIPVLGSISAVLFVICTGLVIFIIFRIQYYEKATCCYRRTEKKEYVMHNVTKVDNHQYQDLGSDQKKIGSSRERKKSSKENLENIEKRNVYDSVAENKEGEYLNIS